MPLRAIVAYLFCEVAKNFCLIHHTDRWIELVSRSQRGDRCFDIHPQKLPSRDEMRSEMDWEKGARGPELLARWMARGEATSFDYNRGLDNRSLAAADPPPPHLVEGTSFFRGLALIDLAEAMLKRVFGDEAVAVRVNGAGQGDYFQVHIDTTIADVEEVKQFLRNSFYRRFGITPPQEFVDPSPGGAAVGVRLNRFDKLPRLIRELRARVSKD
jgi:hypothetical protein